MFLRKVWLKKFLAPTIATGCVLHAASFHASTSQSIFQFEAMDIDGNSRKLSDYEGIDL
jgi:hypothetical protein